MKMDSGKGLTPSLKQGKKTMDSFPDASAKLPKGPSVDSDATRKEVAKSGSISKGRTA